MSNDKNPEVEAQEADGLPSDGGGSIYMYSQKGGYSHIPEEDDRRFRVTDEGHSMEIFKDGKWVGKKSREFIYTVGDSDTEDSIRFNLGTSKLEKLNNGEWKELDPAEWKEFEPAEYESFEDPSTGERLFRKKSDPLDLNLKMKKTELEEVSEAPSPHVPPTVPDIIPMVVKIAKAAAMESIKEEVDLYRGLVADAETVDDRLKIVREISDLKLRSTGLVLAGMRQAGGGQSDEDTVQRIMAMGAESLNPDSFTTLTTIINELKKAKKALSSNS